MERKRSSGKFISEYKHFKGDLLFCKSCDEYKDTDCFYNRKDLPIRSFKDYTCKECTKKLKKSEYVYKSKYKIVHLSTLNGFLKSLLQHSKSRIKRDNDITIEDLIEVYEKQNGLCCYTGIKMTHIAGEGVVQENISIDRIDSSRNYTKDNIQLVCRIVNIMKSNSSEEYFLNICKLITNNNK